MCERNIFEGIGENVEFEIENTDALKELFNKTKEEYAQIYANMQSDLKEFFVLKT